MTATFPPAAFDALVAHDPEVIWVAGNRAALQCAVTGAVTTVERIDLRIPCGPPIPKPRPRPDGGKP